MQKVSNSQDLMPTLFADFFVAIYCLDPQHQKKRGIAISTTFGKAQWRFSRAQHGKTVFLFNPLSTLLKYLNV